MSSPEAGPTKAELDREWEDAERARVQLYRQWEEGIERAVSLFERHPDFPKCQVRMRKRMALVDKRYLVNRGSRLRWAIHRFDLRAQAFSDLVSDIETQNAFIGVLEFFYRYAVVECLGWPPEFFTSPSEESAQAIAQIDERRREWVTKGYERLAGTSCKKPGRAAARAVERCGWLDQMLRRNGSLSSDKDIEKFGGPTYNTIDRYRSGKKSNRELYVRSKFAKVFNCAIEDVPE